MIVPSFFFLPKRCAYTSCELLLLFYKYVLKYRGAKLASHKKDDVAYFVCCKHIFSLFPLVMEEDH